MSNQLTLLGGELDFIIQVGKTIDGNTNFFIREQFEQQSFNATNCENRVPDLEVHLRDLSIGDTLYEQVFDFSICDENEISDLEVNRIVYSIERGIEYIQFENGGFLKQL